MQTLSLNRALVGVLGNLRPRQKSCVLSVAGTVCTALLLATTSPLGFEVSWVVAGGEAATRYGVVLLGIGRGLMVGGALGGSVLRVLGWEWLGVWVPPHKGLFAGVSSDLGLAAAKAPQADLDPTTSTDAEDLLATGGVLVELTSAENFFLLDAALEAGLWFLVLLGVKAGLGRLGRILSARFFKS